jgi:hypothetical protein
MVLLEIGHVRRVHRRKATGDGRVHHRRRAVGEGARKRVHRRRGGNWASLLGGVAKVGIPLLLNALTSGAGRRRKRVHHRRV